MWEVLRAIALNQVYYSSRLDRIPCSRVAVCSMIVMLLDSSVSLFTLIYFVDGAAYIRFATWFSY